MSGGIGDAPDYVARGHRRLIRTMERRGGSGFRVLRSAETGLRVYRQRGRIMARRRGESS